MVIDGNSIINRAFYGIRMLTTHDGTPTNAVYGFITILQKLLEEENLALVPGNAFGDAGEGYVRISYAYSLENLKEAIGRLERFVKKLRATI